MKTIQMAQKALFTLFIISSFWANAQTQFVIGHVDLMSSKILNDERFIWIHIPKSSDSSGIFSSKRYPVVYLLDGDHHFYGLAGMIEQLSAYGLVCPEMIIVGITNTDRTRDLTPTKTSTQGFGETSGGGEKFIAFIEKELMPYIEAKYPTEPYKMLIGHSLGGLTVLNTLIHHTDLFNAYVAIDPSLWWDNQKLLKESKTVLADKKFDNKSLFLSIANTLKGDMTLEKALKDTSGITNHIRSIFEFKNLLENNKQNGLKSKTKYYGDDSHSTVPFISEYDALHFIFDFYPSKLSPNDAHDSSGVFADKFVKHYAEVSKQMGYQVKPFEMELYSMAFDALHSTNIAQAERFFKLLFDYYPESFLAYDAYGDYLLKTGDTKNAKAHFIKALSIKEIEGTRRKLDDVKEIERTLKFTREELQLYTGEFVVAGTDLTIKTYIINDKLMVSTTGQPDSELYSTVDNEFKVKNIKNFSLKFQMGEDKATAVELTSPTGQFTALPKK
jgi:uncharacterized protein